MANTGKIGRQGSIRTKFADRTTQEQLNELGELLLALDYATKKEREAGHALANSLSSGSVFEVSDELAQKFVDVLTINGEQILAPGDSKDVEKIYAASKRFIAIVKDGTELAAIEVKDLRERNANLEKTDKEKNQKIEVLTKERDEEKRRREEVEKQLSYVNENAHNKLAENIEAQNENNNNLPTSSETVNNKENKKTPINRFKKPLIAAGILVLIAAMALTGKNAYDMHQRIDQLEQANAADVIYIDSEDKNYTVEDIEGLLAQLRENNVTIERLTGELSEVKTILEDNDQPYIEDDVSSAVETLINDLKEGKEPSVIVPSEDGYTKEQVAEIFASVANILDVEVEDLIDEDGNFSLEKLDEEGQKRVSEYLEYKSIVNSSERKLDTVLGRIAKEDGTMYSLNDFESLDDACSFVQSYYRDNFNILIEKFDGTTPYEDYETVGEFYDFVFSSVDQISADYDEAIEKVEEFEEKYLAEKSAKEEAQAKVAEQEGVIIDMQNIKIADDKTIAALIEENKLWETKYVEMENGYIAVIADKDIIILQRDEYINYLEDALKQNNNADQPGAEKEENTQNKEPVTDGESTTDTAPGDNTIEEEVGPEEDSDFGF